MPNDHPSNENTAAEKHEAFMQAILGLFETIADDLDRHTFDLTFQSPPPLLDSDIEHLNTYFERWVGRWMMSEEP